MRSAPVSRWAGEQSCRGDRPGPRFRPQPAGSIRFAIVSDGDIIHVPGVGGVDLLDGSAEAAAGGTTSGRTGSVEGTVVDIKTRYTLIRALNVPLTADIATHIYLAILTAFGTDLGGRDALAVLQVARSNVSNSLRELQTWGIVRITHVLGDRRDHFETESDPWELMRIIVRERKAREFATRLRDKRRSR